MLYLFTWNLNWNSVKSFLEKFTEGDWNEFFELTDTLLQAFEKRQSPFLVLFSMMDSNRKIYWYDGIIFNDGQ
jgi:hypothetical protein